MWITGHSNWYHSKAWVHSNCGTILSRLQDISTYWLKIAKSVYPLVFSTPTGDCQNFAKMLIIIKLDCWATTW